jgi:hypothetical protein
VAGLHVLDPARVGRLPAEQCAGPVVGHRVVEPGEAGEEAEVLRRLLLGDALGLDAELAGNRLRDDGARDAYVADASRYNTPMS